MGDRTTVYLTVPASMKERAEAQFGSYTPIDENAADVLEGFHRFTFDEVNYGELPFLENLTSEGIPYDSDWCQGGEYGEGMESCRFIAAGGVVIKTVYACDANPSMQQLIARIDHPDMLRQFILEHQAHQKSLPWDNQEEYSKLYRMIQLIT